ncbi:MAG: dockerin type I domain-containing protein [bacterium]
MKWARILGAMAIALLFSLAPISANRTPVPTCGDLDYSGDIDLSDAVILFHYIFGEETPLPDQSIADVNCDGRINISDVTYLLAYVFYDGAAPCAECPVGGNHAPIIHSFYASQTTLPSSGGMVDATVVAEDEDGDILTYFYSTTYGSVSGSGSQATWTLPANSSSSNIEALLLVTVSDGQASANATLSVLVQGQGPATTQISGTLQLQAGESGNLDNTEVAIYATLSDWNNYAPAMFTAAVGIGAGASATYLLSPVAQGTWYLDAWKDNDGNYFWSPGDIVGWYGSGSIGNPTLSAFSLAQGEHKVININNMIVIP